MLCEIKGQKVPTILALAAQRAAQTVDQSWAYMPRLQQAVLQSVQEERRGSTRRLRKEMREAISCVLQIIFKHLDLSTMRVGVYDRKTGQFVQFSIAYLAKAAGLGERRAQRALQWLSKAGYVTGYKQYTYDEENDKYINKPALRIVNKILLYHLGITQLALQRAIKSSKSYIQKIMIAIHRASGMKKNSSVGEGGFAKKILSKFASPPKTNEKYNKDLIRFAPLAQKGLNSDQIKSFLPAPENYSETPIQSVLAASLFINGVERDPRQALNRSKHMSPEQAQQELLILKSKGLIIL